MMDIVSGNVGELIGENGGGVVLSYQFHDGYVRSRLPIMRDRYGETLHPRLTFFTMGLINLTRYLNKDLAIKNIRVNCVAGVVLITSRTFH